jgi:polyhydroxyalkanoate synthesis regulator phasin
MNNRDKAIVFDFLIDILNQKGEPQDKTEALLTYLKETSKNDSSEKLLHRVSDIFSKDITSMYTSFSTTQVEIMRHKIEILESRISQIEHRREEQPTQWVVIQGIVWVVSLIAALSALYMGIK